MSNTLSQFFVKHKYLCYAYIMWVIFHIVFLILGQNENGFFPFGFYFFDIDDYGFLEFFVYVIAIPVFIFIFTDVIGHSERARAVLKWIAFIVLLVISSVVFFLFWFSTLGGIFGFIAPNDIGKNSIWELIFDFRGLAHIICFLACLVFSLLYLFRMVRLWKVSEKEAFRETGLCVVVFVGVGLLFWWASSLFEKGYDWAIVLYFTPLIVLFVAKIVSGHKRRAKQRALIKKYGKTFGKDIYHSRVRVGMTIEQCKESWGEPLDTYDIDNPHNSIVPSNQEDLQLVYNGHNLFFSYGILRRIETREKKLKKATRKNVTYHSGELTLHYLDVSENTKLTQLRCWHNQLRTLIVSKNSELQVLTCSNNQLPELNVSNNLKLYWLDCHHNQLSNLDVSKNVELRWIDCGNNQLAELDVSNNLKLSRLECCHNQLSNLDVSKNVELQEFECSNNQLAELNVGNNGFLSSLQCNHNQLVELNVSNNLKLSSLDCGSNQLAELSVLNNTELVDLRCCDNQFTQLDVCNNTLLQELYCNDNLLHSLNVCNNIKLRNLICSNNMISSLDVSKNKKLENLQCENNQLTTLDVSRNKRLKTLICTGNSNLTIILKKGQNIKKFIKDDDATILYKS